MAKRSLLWKVGRAYPIPAAYTKEEQEHVLDRQAIRSARVGVSNVLGK